MYRHITKYNLKIWGHRFVTELHGWALLNLFGNTFTLADIT